MPHRVVDETDVRAPASLSAVNRGKLCFPRARIPQRSEVIVVVLESGEFLAQLAGAHIAVIIDDRDRFAGRAWEWPGGRGREVRMLRAIVRRDRTHVRDIFYKAPG